MSRVTKIEKMNPQPNEWGIFGVGGAKPNQLDNDGYEIRSWCDTPDEQSILGAWLADLAEECSDITFGPTVKKGKFSKAPDNTDFVELMCGAINPEKIDDEWWWVVDEDRRAECKRAQMES